MGFVVMQKDGVELNRDHVEAWLKEDIVSWPFEVTFIAGHEISKAVKNAGWQRTRISMKGISTQEKLRTLGNWLIERKFDRSSIVQVNNYLGALKRGAQIDSEGVIQK